MTVSRDAVLDVYREGVAAIVGYAARMTPETWNAIACGEWTAAEVAAHVRVVAGWYHAWLDRAERGDASPAFPIGELARRNSEDLRALAPAAPAEHVAAFVASATAYAERLADAWDLAFGYPRGTVTAGQHAALAALEWHTHAWDMARVLGHDHEPAGAAVLARAAAETWLASQGRPPVLDDGGPRDPWRALLDRMGRA
jgi:uncharacterized protein (TIGR03083 family)